MNIDHVCLVTNPKAGNGRLQQDLDTIVAELQNHFSQVDLYETNEPGDASTFIEQLSDIPDLVIGAGGDGTIYELINAIAPLSQRPAFGIIPGGTCNDFSRALGISQNPVEAVRQICNQQFRPIDVGKSNDQYFLNFWGIGLITEVSSNIDPKMKESFGRLSYYMSVLQTISEDRSFKLRLESDECAYEGDAAMVLVGNGPFTGGVRAFFPQSDIEDGKLEVLIIESNRFQTFWDMLRSKVMQDVPNSEDILYFQSSKISIETTPDQRIDCDGERDKHTPSTIEVLPGHIRMAVGEYPLDR